MLLSAIEDVRVCFQYEAGATPQGSGETLDRSSLLSVPFILRESLARRVQEVELPARRHQIEDLYHLEFLAAQLHPVADLRRGNRVHDCPGVISRLHDVRNLVNHIPPFVRQAVISTLIAGRDCGGAT